MGEINHTYRHHGPTSGHKQFIVQYHRLANSMQAELSETTTDLDQIVGVENFDCYSSLRWKVSAPTKVTYSGRLSIVTLEPGFNFSINSVGLMYA